MGSRATNYTHVSLYLSAAVALKFLKSATPIYTELAGDYVEGERLAISGMVNGAFKKTKVFLSFSIQKFLGKETAGRVIPILKVWSYPYC